MEQFTIIVGANIYLVPIIAAIVGLISYVFNMKLSHKAIPIISIVIGLSLGWLLGRGDLLKRLTAGALAGISIAVSAIRNPDLIHLRKEKKKTDDKKEVE